MKITVRPTMKTWLPDGHDGEIRYTGCAEYLCVQMNAATRKLNTGLTKEDEARLEKALHLDEGTLSAYNALYWGDFRRTIKIDKNGLILDTDNPADEIIYLNLKAHTAVANSEQELIDSPFGPTFRYVITSDEEEARVKNSKNKLLKDAYKLQGKMSTASMKSLLKIAGKRVAEDSSLDFIEAQVFDMINADPGYFIELVNDPAFEMKVFVLDCINIRSLLKQGPKFILNGADFADTSSILGFSIDEVVSYLQDPLHQDVYMGLKAKLEVSKK